MTTHFTVGERIAWYRRRRGLSQEVLAGRVGRTTDWLSKIENGRIELDRLSVLRLLADALDVTLADLIAEPSLMEWTEDSGQHTVPALRSVLMDYRPGTGFRRTPTEEPVHLDELVTRLDNAWTAYQAARFGYVTAQLAALIPDAKTAAAAYDGDESRVASGRLALAYHLSATLLTKLGETDLAWTASNRGMEAAQTSENPVVIGSLLRSLSHSLQSAGEYAEAVRLTHDAIDYLDPHMAKAGRTLTSVYGMALLAGSMAAARADDRATVRDFLDGAGRAATRLGSDRNLMWTAFGPTNVAIHRVSTSMELGDLQVALSLGPTLDTSAVPTERRVRHALEVSRAYSSANRRDEAIATILEAEQAAPEQVRYHYLSRHLVQTWIRTQRGKPALHLVELAQRVGVA
ncbi:helix-turn-helix transcriptional regulator [Nocardioides sp. NPDC127503]|uniref:helix-turn-helix domain-containing protein n=1 Tax=Nocardioides sp. NPDC127503 TaxID=3154516 RepID=UPI003328F8A5